MVNKNRKAGEGGVGILDGSYIESYIITYHVRCIFVILYYRLVHIMYTYRLYERLLYTSTNIYVAYRVVPRRPVDVLGWLPVGAEGRHRPLY